MFKMIYIKDIYYNLPILLIPISLFINYISSILPNKVEAFYSNGLYKLIGQLLSSFTGIIPISLSELIFYSIILLFLLKFFQFVMEVIENKALLFNVLLNYLLSLLKLIGITYFIFILIWGINYHRLPFSQIVGLDTRPSSIEELEILCRDLIKKSNLLRKNISEDENGIMKIQGGYRSVFNRVDLGYREIAKLIPELRGNYGKPKPVILSYYMSYTGISGIYFPFTGEANVNVHIPDIYLPSTTSHEMAHQRGFAREDEANYIAYLTATYHPHRDFQYSGTVLALIHSMNAMYKYDKELHGELKKEYGDALKRDLIFINNYWKKFQGPVEKASTRMNDIYLKSNMQHDGVYSYGRMVDLLLAEYRDKSK